MFSRIMKFAWLMLHSEKRLLKLLLLEGIVLAITVVLSLQLFGVRQYHIKQSMNQSYYRLYSYNVEKLNNEQVDKLKAILSTGYGKIVLSEPITEQEGFSVVAFFGQDPSEKVYGTSLSEIASEEALSSVVVPEEYYVVHQLEVGDRLQLFGGDFEVVGINGGNPNTCFLITPSAVVQSDLSIREVEFYIPTDISKLEYHNVLTQLKDVLKSEVIAEDYDAEISSIASGYSVYSFAIFMLGVVNLMFIQQHIQNRKKRFYAIIQLTGATHGKMLAISIAEILLVFSVGYGIGTLTLAVAQGIYSIITTEHFYLLYANDYIAFYVMYLIGFCIPAIFAYRRFIHLPQILVYKESE